MTGFFFVVSGCQEDTVELVVTQNEITPVLAMSDPEEIVSCDQAVEYLVTFQVPRRRCLRGCRAPAVSPVGRALLCHGALD